MIENDIKVTVFIPTYNGDKYLKQILRAVFDQKVEFKYEVLIIDSGSTDKTLDIIHKFEKDHANLRLLEIKNSEYGHGKTRNFAAQIANGEIIAYLSHDAVPANRTWLYEIVKPFEMNERVMGVVGKQTARPKCVPLLKYEIRSVFRAQGSDFGVTLYENDISIKSKAVYNLVTFYSDVNSATRRQFLIDTIPYRDVPYAEDYIFGKDIVDAGYIKVYAGQANVIHSNDLTLREYKHRIFDETVGVRRLRIPVHRPSIKHIVKRVVIESARDSVRTFFDKEYSPKRKFYWLIVNPLYHIEKWRGIRLATSIDIKDEIIFEKYSLERRRSV